MNLRNERVYFLWFIATDSEDLEGPEYENWPIRRDHDNVRQHWNDLRLTSLEHSVETEI